MEKKVIRNKPSAVRDRIMAILEERREALAHKDFQNIFSKKWDRVTIYRALDKLVEEGKIHKVTGQEGLYSMLCVVRATVIQMAQTTTITMYILVV